MHSIWSESISKDNYKKLDGDVKTDVLIIGGGMAGILCAYFLHKKGVRYILVEGGRIGGGITKNTTAKITAQHGLIYNHLLEKFGQEKAKMYLTANLAAVAKFRDMCMETACDFEEKDSYVYTLSDRKKIEDEISALNKLGLKAKYAETLPLPLDIKCAVQFERQAQFNPIKFINAISSGLNIYENTFVENISSTMAKTKNGTITAEKIIIATHFPIINLAGLYSFKLYQHRSYVIALENAPNVNGMYVDEAENGMSFRNYGDYLLIGGGDHRTGKQGGNLRELRNFKETYYPNAIEHYAWAAQDCMSLDGVPYIGKLSQLYPDIYVATGFNKWGMTSSMVSAEILCDMILGNKSNNAEVFSPSRSPFQKQLGINLGEAAMNLLSIGGKRCSHLGCKLKWNNAEKTWDCPCHGSRYSEEGKVIDNPAKKGINV